MIHAQYFLLCIFIFVHMQKLNVCASDDTPDHKICPKFIKRNEWGARASIQVNYQIIPVSKVIVLSTKTHSCDKFTECSRILRRLQKIFLKQKFPNIEANFYISNDGTVYEGTGLFRIGSHTADQNEMSVGIAFIGNHEDELPSVKALKVFNRLLECLENVHYLDNSYKLYGHHQFMIGSKNPGTALYEYIQVYPRFSENI